METLRDRPEVNFGKIATYLPSSRSLPQVGARMRPLGKLATMTVPPTAPWWKKIKPLREQLAQSGRPCSDGGQRREVFEQEPKSAKTDLMTLDPLEELLC